MLKSLCLALHLCTSLSGTAYVIDGDTIEVESYRIRLHGLDAEEMTEPNGKRAFTGMWILTFGNTITCKFTGEKSYNRYVASCFTQDGKDLAAQMIEHGLALDCARYSQGKYRALEPVGIRSKLKQAPYC